MAVSVTNQTYIFLYSLLAGAAASVLFDLFRTFRRLVRAGTVWVGVQDLLYWLLFGGAAFVFLYRVNFGELRWYIFFGIFLGAFFYYLLLRNRMVSLLLLLSHAIWAVLRILFRILLFPLRLLYRIFSPVFFFVWTPGRTLGHRIFRKTRAFFADLAAGVKKMKKRLKMY